MWYHWRCGGRVAPADEVMASKKFKQPLVRRVLLLLLLVLLMLPPPRTLIAEVANDQWGLAAVGAWIELWAKRLESGITTRPNIRGITFREGFYDKNKGART